MNSPPLKSCALSHLPIPEGCEFLTVGLIQTNQNEWQPCSVPSKEAALAPLYASFCKAAYIRKDIWDAWLSFPDVDPAQALAQVADFCSYMALEDREGRFRSWYEGPGKDSPLKDALLSQYRENGWLFDEMRTLLYGESDPSDGDLNVDYVSGFVQLQAMSMLMQTTRRVWAPSVEESSHYESGYQFFNVHIEMLMHTVHIAYKEALQEIPKPSGAAYQEMSDMTRMEYVPAPDKILRIDQRLRKCTIGHDFEDPFEYLFQEAKILINAKDYSGAERFLCLLARLCGPYDRRLVSLIEAWGRLKA